VNSLDHQSYLLQNVLWKGSSFKIPHQIHDFGHISDLLLTASQQFFRSGEMKRVLTGPVVIVVPRFREADLAGEDIATVRLFHLHPVNLSSGAGGVEDC